MTGDVTREELASRIGENGLVVIDVRTREEFSGAGGYPCDPRQGHIPGARNLDVQVLASLSRAEEIRALYTAKILELREIVNRGT